MCGGGVGGRGGGVGPGRARGPGGASFFPLLFLHWGGPGKAGREGSGRGGWGGRGGARGGGAGGGAGWGGGGRRAVGVSGGGRGSGGGGRGAGGWGGGGERGGGGGGGGGGLGGWGRGGVGGRTRRRQRQEPLRSASTPGAEEDLARLMLQRALHRHLDAREKATPTEPVPASRARYGDPQAACPSAVAGSAGQLKFRQHAVRGAFKSQSSHDRKESTKCGCRAGRRNGRSDARRWTQNAGRPTRKPRSGPVAADARDGGRSGCVCNGARSRRWRDCWSRCGSGIGRAPRLQAQRDAPWQAAQRAGRRAAPARVGNAERRLHEPVSSLQGFRKPRSRRNTGSPDGR